MNDIQKIYEWFGLSTKQNTAKIRPNFQSNKMFKLVEIAIQKLKNNNGLTRKDRKSMLKS